MKYKEDVQYTPHAQKHSERCEVCRFYITPRGCEKVRGLINPQGWCRLWQKNSEV